MTAVMKIKTKIETTMPAIMPQFVGGSVMIGMEVSRKEKRTKPSINEFQTFHRGMYYMINQVMD